MAELVNMQLEPVRTVLQNEVNEITVCVDLRRKTGVFYTMVSVTEPGTRLRVAALLADGGLFSQNSDFIGSFSQGERLNLVFLYRQENLLSRQEAFYATSFPRRRRIAENLAVALAEAQAAGPVGELLLQERNVNINPDLTVYFNYFLDFRGWRPEGEEDRFFRLAAQRVFELLARDYEEKHQGQLYNYPGELQAFYKKTQTKGFHSISGILAAVKGMPDQPAEPRLGWRRLLGSAQSLGEWLKAQGMAAFVAALVAATLAYTGYQLVLRLSYRSAAEKNTAYAGLEVIGDVRLGDDTI